MQTSALRKKASVQGSLDFELKPEADDELGKLCQSLEEMRGRLKESAEEKLKYDKESKELISNISHDLKTPVTTIKGYAEGIIDGVADTPEKIDRYVRTIYNKATEMNTLINDPYILLYIIKITKSYILCCQFNRQVIRTVVEIFIRRHDIKIVRDLIRIDLRI